jgi:predicted metal-binding protein
MGYIEIFRMNEEGAGWVDLSEATSKEMLDLEIGLFQEGALFTTKEAN